LFSVQGEYSARDIAAAIGGAARESRPAAADLPARPPALCPGCQHRGVFYVLGKLKATVTGDIGCYTLGTLPPLSAMDTCVCMGASIGMALGMEKALGRESARNIVAVIGDSTFIHSGITGLIDTVYNGGRTTVIILDNSTTGMTGHQQNPATGLNIHGEQAPRVDLEALCRAVGVTDIAVVDPYDLRAAEAAIRRAMEHNGPSVVIARRACALLDRKSRGTPASVDAALCIGCRRCIGLGCPALSMRDGRAEIDPALCTGCGLCAGVCPADAIGGGNGSCGK
ncbi:MAG: 4Fe-4S binding protein, partial [Clostridiales bacterium]|nr:4Fe-4S binding protein [Clostridiales bacterium]